MTATQHHGIPDSVLDYHIAILGKTGSGKSYAAKGLVERLLRQERRVCIIDPTSGWWGLRADASGKRPGFGVYVLGGPHGDAALSHAHGTAIAEVAGTTNTPMVLDTRLMSVGERTRFFADFAEALLRKNKGRLHLVIDEAHLFSPQGRVMDPQSGRMLHAANNLVSLGRGIGLRIMLISQRPAKLHKDSLTQVETLIAMRVIAPQDRKAIEEWIDEQADGDDGARVLKSLSGLPTGEGWVWCPLAKILSTNRFPKITTFDSSQAPDGDTAAEVVLAKIDLKAIEDRLETIAADAFNNDPARLRQQIAELQRQAKKVEPPEPRVERVEVPILKPEQIAELRQSISELAGLGQKVQDIVGEITDSLVAAAPASPPSRVFVRPGVFQDQEAFTRAWSSAEKPMPVRNSVVDLESKKEKSPTGGLRRILVALAQRNHLSVRQIGVRASLSSKSGTFDTYLSTARKNGWIEGPRERVSITSAGVQAIGNYEPLPTGRDLLRHWLDELTGGARRMLEALAASHPRSLTVEELGVRCNMAMSGTFDTYLSKLRTLELITGSRGALMASPEFFE